MLLVGQSGKAAADDGMFPKIFARINRHGVPGVGLIIVSVLMTLVLFATMSPTLAEQFNRIVDLAVILIIVPYVYSAVADAQGAPRPRGVAQDFRDLQGASRSSPLPIACGPCVGGDPKTVVHALVALLISVPLYPFFMRSMAQARDRKLAMKRESRLPDMYQKRSPP